MLGLVRVKSHRPHPAGGFYASSSGRLVQWKNTSFKRLSLLARLKDWSQQTAWRQFEHDYAPLLRNVALKAGLRDVEAGEVTQETLIAVAKKIAEFHHAGSYGSFRAWLYQQARWRIADQFRARARAKLQISQNALSAEAEHETGSKAISGSGFPQQNCSVAPSADPVFERLWETEWEEHIRQSALIRLKRQVSPRQFQLFDLHVLQGLPVRAAAKTAGTSIAAIYMAKSRIGRLFKREVKALKAL